MKKILFLLVMMIIAPVYSDEKVVSDDSVFIGAAEIKVIVESWSMPLRKKVLEDNGLRRQLLLQVLMNKKLAKKQENEKNLMGEELLVRYEMAIDKAAYEFYLAEHIRSMEYPDFKDLSKELYSVRPEKYAKAEEQRYVSHIYLQCLERVCEEKEALASKAKKELKLGLEFGEVVKKYSEDDLTIKSDGKLAGPVSKLNTQISAKFKDALFGLKEVGSISEIIKTQYGYHILRLDKIKSSYVKDYEEVADKMIANLRSRFKSLSLKVLQKDILNENDVEFNDKKISSILEEMVK